MIKIHQGRVLEAEGVSTLSTVIEIDGAPKDVRISVSNEYGKFLSPERADYALVGMLAFALRNRHDIICEAPVTDELLYNVRELLLPTFIRTDTRNYPVKIQADIAPPLNKLDLANAPWGVGVGTGMSCGVDSFFATLKHLNSPYPSRRLTHLCVFNNGSINSCYGKENIPYVKQKVFERAEAVAKEFNLPLLKLESNFQIVIPQNHLYTHTYMDSLAIYSLQKLWQVWYRSSGNYAFSNFSLKDNCTAPPARFEPLILDCFSTSKLKIYSTGSEGDRNDKIFFIADNPIAQKYLHVCLTKATNCGWCKKCLRTLLQLDAANKLYNFRQVFDIDDYLRNRDKAFVYLYNEIKNNPGDLGHAGTYKILYERYKDFFDSLKAN